MVALLFAFLTSGVSAQDGTTETTETVTKPELRTLTADDSENGTGNDNEYYYEGNIALLVMSGSTADETPAVSGVIYKWSTEKAYTKDDFANHAVPSATTVTMPATIVTLERRTVDYYLTAIAYKTGSDGKRIYSDAVSRKYIYKATSKKELTLNVGQSSITLEPSDTDATTTISAQDGESTTITGLSYTAYSSNRKIAESTMSDNTLTVTGQKIYGIASVMIITKGNDSYKPAFAKVNVNVKISIPAMTSTPAVYKSIANFRAAGEQNLKQTGILQFDKDNPATVVARLVRDDTDMKDEGKNNIFIVDNSGYGLMVYYEDNKGAKFIDDNKLYAGSTFTGTLIGQYKQRKSNIPEISDMEISSSETVDGVVYLTEVTVDHSGEGTAVIGASVPVTDVANIYTINSNLGNGSSNPSTVSYGPYLNTIVTVPGTIVKGSGEYYLVQDNHTYNEDQYSINLNADQIGVDLDNYIGLSGIFTGLIIKRDNSSVKLVVVSSNFFNANEITELKISESDDENYVKEIYETGALANNVNVKIHRTNWTTDTWGTICLPFDLTATEFETAFGTSISALASCSGTVENGVLKFTELTDKDITAGVPYLIKVASAGNIKGTGKDKSDEDSYYATIENRKITASVPQKVEANYDDTNENAIINGTFYFCGLYGKKNKDDEGNSIAGNQKYQYISTKEGQYLYYLPENSTVSFSGLRAYLYFPNWSEENNNKLANSGTSSLQNRSLVIGTGEGTTAIKGIAVEEQANGKIFNLAGQYVGNSTTGLTKGIYIRDGKKFVIK